MRSKRAQWARRVAGWRRSGLSAGQYAESVGVNANTLQYWSWRLKSEREGMGEAGVGSTPAVSSLIEVVGNTSIESRFELELRCGRRVWVPSGFDAAELSRVVSTLEEMAPAGKEGPR